MATVNEPVYDRFGVRVFHGDNVDVLRNLPDCSIDSIVTDPPYGLEFIGDKWRGLNVGGHRPTFGKPDGSKFRQNMGTPSWGATGNPTCRNCRGDKYRNGPRKCRCAAPDFGNHAGDHNRAFQAWCQTWAAAALRVLKPGGHAAIFGGTRTFHRVASGVEDAGFEITDQIGASLYGWVHNKGMPKGRDQLRPAWEPILIARRPLAGSVSENVDRFGVGVLYVDRCRGPENEWPTNVLREPKAPTSERPMVDGEQHPTVKSVALCRRLVRLVTPPGGTVLDLFAGTGTTGQAARAEKMQAILIDDDEQSIGFIRARLDARPKTQAGVASDDTPMDLLDLLGEEAS